MNQCLLNGMYTRQLCYLFYRNWVKVPDSINYTFHNCCVWAILGVTK